ncbi:Eukaryotic translation initiation factor 3 subunit H [Hondaea fermentalgiana]|uniref:Eukaryotic translation initiation factor 3 subunit H n=1 Tax=Hondaea fermentalgiana TaxID=2315210 RepID=A0A2R5GNN8_9STRA|nr:Eukaryotic translation initiation factor 3 subunit H [Hondaea fermentalgiana]|eukprot:GBG29921.1 Eukaryotic translation initiation factor 3 subunit H [Hondaea fermentalgiana]
MSAPRWGAPAADAGGEKAAGGGGLTLAEKLQGKGAASVSAAGMKPPAKLEKVKVDGMVLLKIIKHCEEAWPNLCKGTLLGMDVDSKLEVTNSFPSPGGATGPSVQPPTGGRNRMSREEEEALKAAAAKEDAAEIDAYKGDVLKLLKDINIDCNPVGWYRSVSLSSFCNAQVIREMFAEQDKLDAAVVQRSIFLVYDPHQTKRGNLYFKAYRLSDAFVQLMRDRKKQSSGGNKGIVKLSPAVVAAVGGLKNDGSAVMAASAQDMDLSAEEILEEIPIEITNAHLFTVLIEDLKERNGDRLDVDFDRLNLSTNSYLETNLEFMLEEVNELNGQQMDRNREQKRTAAIEAEQIKWIQERRAENKAREERGEPLLPENGDPNNNIFKPQNSKSNLESLLILKQIGIYCEQVNKFSGSGFSKLYLSNAVQQGHEAAAAQAQ